MEGLPGWAGLIQLGRKTLASLSEKVRVNPEAEKAEQGFAPRCGENPISIKQSKGRHSASTSLSSFLRFFSTLPFLSKFPLEATKLPFCPQSVWFTFCFLLCMSCLFILFLMESAFHCCEDLMM